MARQTRALQKAPSTSAWSQPRLVFVTAIESAVAPTAPLPNPYCSPTYINPPHPPRRRPRPDEVPREDERPVPEQARGRDAAARPRHHDQVVAGEELRAGR